MEIQKNSRQIPKTKDYCSNKKYSDIVYGYLQSISQKDYGNGVSLERYILKKDINFSAIGRELKMTRQTVATKFNNLKNELKLIREEGDRYLLEVLPRDVAELVPQKTLEVLVDALSENAISTYIYLLNRFYANDDQEFEFTYSQIKNWIGVSSKTRSNDNIIQNILFVLNRIGLVEYEMSVKVDDSSFGNVRTVYRIKKVYNNLELLKKQTPIF